MEKIWNFQLSYYVNTSGFIYKSYKPDFIALLCVFNVTWIENGLSTLKWFFCGC